MSEVSTILNAIQEGMAKVPKENQKELAWWLILMNLMDMKDLDGTMTDKEKQEYQQLNQSFKANAKPVKMTKKQAREYVMGLLHGIGKAGFEKDNPNEENNDVLRERFAGYMTGAVKFLIRFSELMGESRSIKNKDLSQWVQEYVDEVYPIIYGKTLQGSLINQIRQIGKRTGSNLFDKDTMIFNSENVQLAFFESDKYNGVAMTVPMQKVLSMLHEELCRILPSNLEDLGKVQLKELSQYSKVRISMDRYMELTDTRDKKTARKTIKEALDRLYHISFVAVVKDEVYKGRLFASQGTPIRGGIFEMEYTAGYLQYCSTTTPAAFHKGMYKINGKLNPYAWGLGEKLWQHFLLSRGKAGNERLSVKKLVAAVPDLPTYDEVMTTNKHVSERIIEPFERDLNELRRLGVLKSWEYSNAKGKALTDEQAELKDYATWDNLYIQFELDMPPQDEYIEAHKRKLKAAKEKAAKRKQAKA